MVSNRDNLPVKPIQRRRHASVELIKRLFHAAKKTNVLVRVKDSGGLLDSRAKPGGGVFILLPDR
jgi:hypothetical protein